MNKKGLLVGISVGFVAVLAVAFIALYYGKVPALGLADAEFIDNASDVYGSKTATTTAGQYFSVTGSGGQSATSTAVKKLGSGISTAIYTLMPITVSSTANIRWEVQGSQDYFCESTVTSGGNLPLVSEINWFSVGDNERGASQSTSYGNASSTKFHTWNNPMAGTGQTLVLENLDYECLRMAMSGSSTEAWVQLSVK